MKYETLQSYHKTALKVLRVVVVIAIGEVLLFISMGVRPPRGIASGPRRHIVGAERRTYLP